MFEKYFKNYNFDVEELPLNSLKFFMEYFTKIKSINDEVDINIKINELSLNELKSIEYKLTY